jgi:hypothetical protein
MRHLVFIVGDPSLRLDAYRDRLVAGGFHVVSQDHHVSPTEQGVHFHDRVDVRQSPATVLSPTGIETPRSVDAALRTVGFEARTARRRHSPAGIARPCRQTNQS